MTTIRAAVEARCRHCSQRIKLCNCGANFGREHWSFVGYPSSRYCPGKAVQLHEPEETDHA